MFQPSPRRIHSLLIAPALLPLLMLLGPKVLDNHPPVAASDSYTIHGCPITLNPGVTANDSDPDNDPLFISGFPQSPAHGGVSQVGNNVSYCPNSGYVGSDSFTYTLCDNHGACTTGNVTLNIVNQPPNGVDDSYNVHGTTEVGPFLANDSDPEGDAVTMRNIVNFPEHGGLSGVTQNDKKLYGPNFGYVGPDSFTYQVCDSLNLCSVATVHLNVVNQPPVGGDDFYNVHGATEVGPFFANDSDPDGDQISGGNILTFPQHGSLSGVTQNDKKLYSPSSGYVGPDSFTYQLCDNLGKCSAVTVNISVNNNPPVAGDDAYLVPGPSTTIGPFLVNDSDPDGDGLSQPDIVDFPQHGSLSGVTQPDEKLYSPNDGYTGIDRFTYRICDNLGACSTATVTLDMGGDGKNNGSCNCNECVGEPVNVTTGNVYLEQSDYQLSGVGPITDITRSYNSMSQAIGIFGRGWSTMSAGLHPQSSDRS